MHLSTKSTGGQNVLLQVSHRQRNMYTWLALNLGYLFIRYLYLITYRPSVEITQKFDFNTSELPRTWNWAGLLVDWFLDVKRAFFGWKGATLGVLLSLKDISAQTQTRVITCHKPLTRLHSELMRPAYFLRVHLHNEAKAPVNYDLSRLLWQKKETWAASANRVTSRHCLRRHRLTFCKTLPSVGEASQWRCGAAEPSEVKDKTDWRRYSLLAGCLSPSAQVNWCDIVRNDPQQSGSTKASSGKWRNFNEQPLLSSNSGPSQ